MKDFIQHALPWIIVGLMVVLTMAHYAKKKRFQETKTDPPCNGKDAARWEDILLPVYGQEKAAPRWSGAAQ